MHYREAPKQILSIAKHKNRAFFAKYQLESTNITVDNSPIFFYS